MKSKLQLLLVLFVFLPFDGFSQRDTLISKLDSLGKIKDSIGFQINKTDPHLYDEHTQLNFRSYFSLLATDLKREFTKPFHMKRKDWRNLGWFVLAQGALAFADRPIQRYGSGLSTNNRGLANASQFITDVGGKYEFLTLAAFGTYGYVFKKKKMQTTTLLVTQAYVVGGVLSTAAKYVAGRTRPSFYGPGEKARPRFHGPFDRKARAANGHDAYSSYPSGHTTVAFAAATVFAMEYSNKPWVPIVAYSSATLIGLSRITQNKHWATDVLAGAAIGYLAGQSVVNNYHRYAKLKAPSAKKKGTFSVSMQYAYGQVRPNLLYRF